MAASNGEGKEKDKRTKRKFQYFNEVLDWFIDFLRKAIKSITFSYLGKSSQLCFAHGKDQTLLMSF